MPSFRSIATAMKYVPMLIGIVQQLRGKQRDTTEEEIQGTRSELEDFKKNVGRRLEELEKKHDSVNRRLKSAEATLFIYRWLTVALLVIAFAALVLAIIAIAHLK